MATSRARNPLLATAAVVLLAALAFAWFLTRDTRPPHIVLISVDTVRADRLGAYGHHRATSPVLDELARTGVLYENALATAPWTLPSLASLLSGLYPSEHNTVDAHTALAREIRTVAEALADAGYLTIGVVSNEFASGGWGMDQGFEVFDETQKPGHLGVSAQALTELAAGHAGRADDRPYFLWVHYFDPHYAYVRHPEFGFADAYAGALPDTIDNYVLNDLLHAGALADADVEHVRAVYDEEIAHNDRWIGELLERLGARRDGRRLVTVLTSDHGEYFLERGRFFHGFDVYDELVAVPLVIGGDLDDGLRGRRVARPVDIASIPRTIMELAGVAGHGFGGEDLLAPAVLEAASGYAFTEGSYAWGDDRRKLAVVLDRWKLIRNLDDGTYELYDRGRDPAERENLWEDAAEDVAAVREHLVEVLARYAARGGTAARAVELDEATVEKLRSLGYVQ